jgi:hypothetical protein
LDLKLKLDEINFKQVRGLFAVLFLELFEEWDRVRFVVWVLVRFQELDLVSVGELLALVWVQLGVQDLVLG